MAPLLRRRLVMDDNTLVALLDNLVTSGIDVAPGARRQPLRVVRVRHFFLVGDGLLHQRSPVVSKAYAARSAPAAVYRLAYMPPIAVYRAQNPLLRPASAGHPQLPGRRRQWLHHLHGSRTCHPNRTVGATYVPVRLLQGSH